MPYEPLAISNVQFPIQTLRIAMEWLVTLKIGVDLHRRNE